MQKPSSAKEYDELRLAVKSLQPNQAFAVVLKWIESELRERDKENRIKGYENKTSEAQALASILETVAACWVQETDRNSIGSDTESRAALFSQ